MYYVMARNINKTSDAEFIEMMLKRSKEKGSPQPKPLTQSVDVEEVERIVKDLNEKQVTMTRRRRI